MKKILILMSVLLVSSLAASAQLVSSTTVNKKSNPALWYVRAGVSFDNVVVSGDSDGLGSKTGFDVDFGFNKSIGRSGLYWGMELGVGTDGYSIKDYQSVLAINAKWSPFTLGYKYAVTDDIKIDGHFGGFVSYDFTGSVSSDEGDSPSWGDFKDYYDWQDLDAGLQLGIGVWYKRFNLDFTWQRGFVNKLDDTAKTSNLMLRLGIAF